EETAQVHSVVNFDPKVEQVLSPGDTLEGKGIPEAKVSISITPDGINGEATADKDGKWTYQIPGAIQPKNYNLTIILEDITGNIASIKSYSIIIQSTPHLRGGAENFMSSHLGGELTLIKPAYAQGIPNPPTVCDPNNQVCPAGTTCIKANPDSPLGYCSGPSPTPSPPPSPRDLQALGSDYSDWLTWMHHLSVYPAWDITAQEIVYVNRETYEREVCGNPDPSRPRCTTSGEVDRFISQIEDRNWEFLQHLASYLRRQCYSPADVMAPYFPDLTGITLDTDQTVNFFSKEDFPSLSFLHTAPGTTPPGCFDTVDPSDSRYFKRSVSDEQELGRLITRAGTNYAFSQEDPMGDFFHATEVATLGFFPTNTFLKLVALKSASEAGYRYNNEIVANAGFAILGIIPPAKVGGAIQQVSKIGHKVALTTRTVMKQRQVAQRVRTIRNAIEKGERVPKSSVDEEIAKNIDEIPVPQLGHLTASLVERLPRTYPAEDELLWQKIVEAVELNRARILDADATTSSARFNLDILSILNLVPPDVASEFMKTASRKWVVVIDDEWKHLFNIAADEGGFTQNRTVLLLRSQIRGDQIRHELHHVLNKIYCTLHPSECIQGWVYGGDGRYNQVMTMFYEYMTSYNSSASAYVSDPEYQRLYKSIHDLVIHLIENSNGRANNVDLARFALTENDHVLLTKLFGRYEPSLLLAYLDGKVDFARLDKIYRQFRREEFFNRLRSRLPGASATLTGLGITAYLGTHQYNGEDPYHNPFVGDDNILTPQFEQELENDEEIEIIRTTVEEDTKTVEVEFVVHQGGISVDPSQFDVTFALDRQAQSGLIKTVHAFTTPSTISQIQQALSAQRLSSDIFQVTIPAFSGSADLWACINRKDSDQVLDCDDERLSSITTPTAEPTQPTGGSSRQIISIKINGIDVDMDNLDEVLNIKLPNSKPEGEPQLIFITVDVTYDDGSAPVHFILPFNYLNYTAQISPTPAALVPSQACTQQAQTNYNSCTNDCNSVPGEEFQGCLTDCSQGFAGELSSCPLEPQPTSSPGFGSLPTPTPTGAGLPAPRGQCILTGSSCGTLSGSNAGLSCCSGACSSLTYGTCRSTYTVPTPLPVGVIATPSPRPLNPTPICRTNQSCNIDTDCGGCGLRCAIGLTGKVCR
ncbi:MAG: hypothetical protein CEO21_252, partial [Microgenomates group bacterium Gr01-1014_80]